MTEPVIPEAVPSVEDLAHGLREAAAADTSHADTNWATKVDRLEVERRDGVRGTNVAGRRLTGPVQGFGKMWQKTYSMDLGTSVTPETAIAAWKAHFPDFWPRGNRFAGALTGISPGDIALLDLTVGGVKLSTGVFVLYADDRSFTLMTPEGHMFAGWITFSAERAEQTTTVQAQVLMRANDPVYEMGLALGGQRKEDRFWAATMTSLARHLGVPDVAVTMRAVVVDPRRQWGYVGNLRHNAMMHSVLQTVSRPLTPRQHRSRDIPGPGSAT